MYIKLASSITVCEVGLRDGMQIEKRILTVEEKLEMIHRLEDAGVRVIEVGSFMHPKAVPQMANYVPHCGRDGRQQPDGGQYAHHSFGIHCCTIPFHNSRADLKTSSGRENITGVFCLRGAQMVPASGCIPHE